MCGIVGSFKYRTPIPNGLIEAMNNSIFRRGPDEEGYYKDDNLHMGMRRLSIIDLKTGSQPIYNETGNLVIVFNGEIYNHKELKSDLIDRGHKFRTTSDTETIIHAFEEYGVEKLLLKLRGMYAFFIWDIPNKRGYLCRDKFGIKPVFYTQPNAEEINFGSEIKALIAAGSEKKISPQSLDAYLTYGYIPAPLTIYENIFKLEPAHYIEIHQGKISKPIEYWVPDLSPDTQPPSESSVLAALQDSVNIHMESDVDIAAFLSGGVDSALVTTLAAQSGLKSAYTARFRNKGHLYDETPLAVAVAKSAKLQNHTVIDIDPDYVAIMKGSALAFDEPFADSSIFPTWEICKESVKKHKVCLTGLGGDEVFLGYSRYRGALLYGRYSYIPRILRKFISTIWNATPVNKSSRRMEHINRFVNSAKFDEVDFYISCISSLPDKRREKLYSNQTREFIDFRKTKELISLHFERLPDLSYLKKCIYSDLKTYLPEDILALSDRIGMWHSLELRVPFIDHLLLRITGGIHEKYNINLKIGKLFLRKIARNLLPKSILKAKKQGFESPTASWLKDRNSEIYTTFLDHKSIDEQGIFNSDEISTLIDDHVSGSSDNSKIIFALACFQAWHHEVYSS